MSDTRFWHGFADMSAVRSREVVLVRGEGSTIWDRDGNDTLTPPVDCGSRMRASAGEIAAAAAAQMELLHAYSSFGAYVVEPALALADRLSALAPMPDAKVFLSSGGSEGIETAAKLVRRYWDVVGRPEKQVIVAREFGYHGMAAYGTSLAGIAPNREGYGGSLIPTAEFVPAMDVDALAALLADHGAPDRGVHRGAGDRRGRRLSAHGRVLARDRGAVQGDDVLLIADEVVTGFGRTASCGAWSGTASCPTCSCSRRAPRPAISRWVACWWGRAWRSPSGSSRARCSATATPTRATARPMAAAMANLDILEREGLVARVAALEPVLDRVLRSLADAPLVTEVRTVGLTGAVELSVPPPVLEQVVAAAGRHGILTRVLRGKALHVSPPFVITEAEIDDARGGLPCRPRGRCGHALGERPPRVSASRGPVHRASTSVPAVPVEDGRRVRQCADPRGAAGVAHERACGLDLGPHGARREGQGGRWRPGGARDGPGVGRAEVEQHRVGVGEHQVRVRAKGCGQQGPRAVLVDDRLHAREGPIAAGLGFAGQVHRGDAAAAGADDHHAVLDEHAHDIDLEDALGQR